jgi:Mn-dependent DtxR family transcriptional regulator
MNEQATVTVGVIAKTLGVSDAKVKKAIETLAIEPVAKRGVCKLYAPETTEAVKKALG